MSGLAILSLFRDRSRLVPEYIHRIEKLEWPEQPWVVCVEGDSKDNTAELLHDWEARRERTTVIEHDLHRPYYGSIINADRFATLATAANVGLDRIAELDVDRVLLLPSDLRYSVDTVQKLDAFLSTTPKAGTVSPMIWIEIRGQQRFYDIWAFRTLEGRHFPPRSPDWFRKHYSTSTFEVSSSGAMVLCRAEAIKQGARLTKEEAVVGLCKNFRSLGYSLHVDPTLDVVHPQLWEHKNGRWT